MSLFLEMLYKIRSLLLGSRFGTVEYKIWLFNLRGADRGE